MKHCIVHLCSAHFGQNKVLITSFSRVLNIQVVPKMLGDYFIKIGSLKEYYFWEYIQSYCVEIRGVGVAWKQSASLNLWRKPKVDGMESVRFVWQINTVKDAVNSTSVQNVCARTALTNSSSTSIIERNNYKSEKIHSYLFLCSCMGKEVKYNMEILFNMFILPLVSLRKEW